MWVSATCHQISTQLAFFRHLEETPCQQALVLTGCWRDSLAEHKQPRRLLEHVDNTLLAWVIEESCSAGPHSRGRTSQGSSGF